MSSEDLPQDLHYSLETEDIIQRHKMEGEKTGTKSSKSPTADLTLLSLSLDAERPMVELSQGDYLETSIPPPTSTLVHHRLEQFPDTQSELMDLSATEDTATEDMEVEEGIVPNAFSGSSEQQLNFTPGSSLTRSSSSDSLQSTGRGQPGLVRQRTQEIETRVRLAGLTVHSQLKRSNSLAKLGDLAISTEDLSRSATVSIDNEPDPALCAQSSCSPKLSLTPTVLQSLKS